MDELQSIQRGLTTRSLTSTRSRRLDVLSRGRPSSSGAGANSAPARTLAVARKQKRVGRASSGTSAPRAPRADVEEKFRAVSISADLVRRAGRNHPIHHKETRMRFMVLVPGSPESEAGEMPSTEILAAMTKYNEELVKAGVMLAGEGLHPTSRGAKVRFNGSERTVTDGPFTEAKEIVAGYWMWECASREEAIGRLKSG